MVEWSQVMPKSKSERLSDYNANNNHIVGSEAWLTEAEVKAKRRIEEAEDPNHPSNSPEAKAARKRKLEQLMNKPLRQYGDMKG
ncbi:conserved hypothetical protein [Vibrio crassostreae]|nr:conserved hypothetical protein [Vibrio crassostreae]CAK2721561.1 conserved hypothetical protein [Vibrio crassostreae]CAK3880857.1 conserved hypothetical protein [Vibrio crassostreae]